MLMRKHNKKKDSVHNTENPVRKNQEKNISNNSVTSHSNQIIHLDHSSLNSI